MTTTLPPLPTNTPHVVRRIRRCESEVPAQVVFEHALAARDAQWMERITALEAQKRELRAALKELLSDTQHAEHPDCEDGPCPVRKARVALENTND